MSPDAPPAPEKPELRGAVLASATKLFLDRPYAEVRVEDIVADAGVAKGLAFYYFQSKRGLYVAVVQSLLGQLVMKVMPDPELSPRKREIAAVSAFVDWAAEIDGIELILSTWAAGDPKTDAIFREAGDRIILQTVTAMRDFPGGPGREDQIPPELLTRAIWGWLAFARIVVADWLRKGGMNRDEVRDLLIGALDGAVDSARKIADER